MSFYGLGYHKYRERWIKDEWFWEQFPLKQVALQENLSNEDIAEHLGERVAEISPFFDEVRQTDLGRMFDCLADTTDDETVLAEFQTLELRCTTFPVPMILILSALYSPTPLYGARQIRRCLIVIPMCPINLNDLLAMVEIVG